MKNVGNYRKHTIEFFNKDKKEVFELFTLDNQQLKNLFPFVKEGVPGGLELYSLDLTFIDDIYVIMYAGLNPIKLSKDEIKYFLPNSSIKNLSKSKKLQRELVICCLFKYREAYQLQLESCFYYVKEFADHFYFLKGK